MQKLGGFDVLADVGSCDKGDTLFLHNIDLAVNDLLSSFMLGMPYINSPPTRSERSNTVT